MPTARERKIRAKQFLHGQLLISAVAVCVAITAASLVSLCVEMAAFAVGAQESSLAYLLLSAGGAVISLFAISPLLYGIRKRSLLTVLGNYVPLSEVFSLFNEGKRYFRYVFMTARIYLRAFLYGSLFYVLGAAGLYLLGSDTAVFSSTVSTLISFSTTLCFVLGGILSIFALVRAFLCDYLFTLDPDCKSGEIMRRAAKLMSGRVAELLELWLRFTPWFLLCLTGIAIPFVAAYYEMTAAVFAKDVIYGGEAQ